MKKLLFLLFAFVTVTMQAQTANGSETQFESVQLTTPQTVTSSSFLTSMGTDGTLGKILPVNITINQPPHPINYSVAAPTLGEHLIGIDTRLGQIVQTTAGITNRIYFTGVPVTISAGTFYTSSAAGKGAVTGVTQTVSNNDNIKSYFAQDVISVAQASTTIAPAGNFSGQLSVMVSDDSAQERYTIEVYKTNNGGTPIASGVTGAPTGSLGVTVVAILDSGILDLTANAVTNISVSGLLASALTINTGERLRYHVSSEKIGTAGAAFTFSLFYGSNYNSYYDVPVTPTTDTVINKSLVTGTTSSDAFNNLNSGLVYKKTIAQIRALSGTLPSNNFYTTDLRQEGNWYYDASDVSTADNTGTVLVTADGKRIKRIFYDSVNIQWFGAIGDNTTDNTTFIQSAISTGKKIFAPEGIFITSNITLLTNSSISGLGEKSILKFKSGSVGYMLNADLVGGISLDKVALYGADDIEYQTVASIGTRSGIYLNTNLPKSKITNCKIYGFNAIGVGYNGTVTSKDNKSIDINNCNFLSNFCAISTAPSGVNHYTSVSGGAGGEYSNIIGSSFYLNRYAVVASAGNTNVTGNVISNNGYGIYTTSVSNVGHGNIVSNLINHSTVNSIEMVDNIISHVISGNSIYSGNIVFTNCTGIIFSSNQISVTGITITGTGFHNFADNFYFLDPIFSGGFTNCLFSNNFSKTLNEFVNNDSFVGRITSGFIPRANNVGRFVNANIYDDGSNIGIGTTSPIGKLNVATGTVQTTDIVSQISGSVSMSNFGSGVAIPLISGKSTSSVGLYVLSSTADVHAGSADMQINVRKTDNTDFTTLTSSAFKLSRFSTTLVDVLRNGNTTFTGSVFAPTATAGTNNTQLATTAFVMTNGRPYKSYVVTASQASTSAPTITVIENGIGAIVWTRSTTGTYDGTLTGAFTAGKTFITISNNSNTNLNIKEILSITSTNVVTLKTYSAGVLTDGVIASLSIEIRVYN